MSRTIQSVHDLWREWDVGLGVGKPAVKNLEDVGRSWHNNTTDKRFFDRRKIIINEIIRLVSSNVCVDHSAAVKKLDQQRSNKSLNWLQ